MNIKSVHNQKQKCVMCHVLWLSLWVIATVSITTHHTILCLLLRPCFWLNCLCSLRWGKRVLTGEWKQSSNKPPLPQRGCAGKHFVMSEVEAHNCYWTEIKNWVRLLWRRERTSLRSLHDSLNLSLWVLWLTGTFTEACIFNWEEKGVKGGPTLSELVKVNWAT